MSSPKEEVHELLKQHGATLIRSKKHGVWEFPGGRKFTVPTSPRDHRSWDNSLAQLKRFLGISLRTQKTQADFEHKKKEHDYKPKHEPQREFLADLPERESRPPTPISESPLVTMRKRMLDQKLVQELEARGETQPLSPYIFGAGKKKHHYRESSARSGHCIVLGPEIKAEAQYLLETEGEQAMNAFLNSKRYGHSLERERERVVNPTTALKEVPVEEQQANQSQPETQSQLQQAAAHSPSFGTMLEMKLLAEKQLVSKYQQEERNAKAEVLRHQRLVDGLERLIQLEQSSLSSLKETLDTEAPQEKKLTAPRGSHTGSGNPHRWRKTLHEILVTSPTPMTKAELVSEAVNLSGLSRDKAYQAVWRFISMGVIHEDEETGIVTWQRSATEEGDDE